MTREEKQKAIDALKISAPVRAVTQEKFNDYIQTLNKVMDWLEQDPCEDIISRKHLLSEIDDLMKSPWFNNGKDDARLHYGYVERKEAVEIVRDLCVKAEPPVIPKPTECEDAVSRKAVKSALCELCGLHDDEKGCPFVNGDCDDLNAINALPPVTPKQRWIPVSERLPEVKGYYLVTGEKYFIPDHDNDIAHYKCVGIGYYSDYLHRFEPSNGIEKFYAWMPLPEPWKGESE